MKDGSLNGGKTRPLTTHALGELRSLLRGPRPRQEINAGVVDRLCRGEWVEIVRRPSPYKTVLGDVQHLQINDAGRAFLDEAGK